LLSFHPSQALLKEVALSFGFELQLLEDADGEAGSAMPVASPASPRAGTGTGGGAGPLPGATAAAGRPRPALEDLRASLRAAAPAAVAPVPLVPLLKRKGAPAVVLAPAAARGLAAAGIATRVDVAKRIRLRR